MSLEEVVRSELLKLRRGANGASVNAISQTDALRHTLCGGDPRVAYNVLKQVLLEWAGDLETTAASYSLGFASAGESHLARLTDFGDDYSYDQRQARRYSDKGILQLARHIATGWTVEASPVLTVTILEASPPALELVIRTQRHGFLEMRRPLLEVVGPRGGRRAIKLVWHEAGEIDRQESLTEWLSIEHVAHAVLPATDTGHVVSILWLGEIWPKFTVIDQRQSAESTGLRVECLGARVQLAATSRPPAGT